MYIFVPVGFHYDVKALFEFSVGSGVEIAYTAYAEFIVGFHILQ